MTTIYTIGHSNHKWDTFHPLLKMHGIELLVDVRSRPVSRFASFANIRILPDLLEDGGMDYLFMGDSLGGKPQDPSLYGDDGKPDYARMARHDGFTAGIAGLISGAGAAKTAIMCSEEDPVRCHRLLLISPALEACGVESLHIRRSGEVAGHLPITA